MPDNALHPVKEIRISVRNLVEFLLRSGDLDNRRRVAPENAMAEGGRIHRMIQRRMGSEYHAEVPLSFRQINEEYELLIEGRADGIIILPEQITIDEIKGTYRELEKITEPEPVHLAQAKCYAHLYSRQVRGLLDKEEKKADTRKGKNRDLKLPLMGGTFNPPEISEKAEYLDTIRIRMTYCNMETEEIRYFFEEYSRKELEVWFNHLISQYKKWADYQVQWEKIRQKSIKEVSFPYPYRKGQKELAAAVYRTIYHGKKLFSGGGGLQSC